MSKVTINNPYTGKTETIGQEAFNRYMSMTNGEVLKWIIDNEQPGRKANSDKVVTTLEEALKGVIIEWEN